ncbi:MAG: 50S ribosomal protein L3 [Candidatus Levyibacteriota bacterium]|nr:MAG: 50S ribosomal protein L3 [Candidatus Levybacteria bacterium]
MQAFIGQKLLQTQAFLTDGTRIPVTKINVPHLPVVAIKTKNKDGYRALQVGWGQRKHPNKAIVGHIRGAKLEKAPRFLREIRLADADSAASIEVGSYIKVADILKPGDMVDVVGISKGKGYAGVVKRHHFKGGPRTHGQSDRERAPGSIGQTTTPGRVYKGKRMSGRMGQDRVTIKNLEVVDVTEGEVLVKGVVPGVRGSLVMIEKVGEKKKFAPLYKEKVEEEEKDAGK